MDIKQLRYFKEIAKYENISRAAQELFISQPALTRSLKQLEIELNTTLFDRQAHRIELNENGRIALKRVDVVLQEIDGLFADIETAARKVKRLRIFASQSFIIRYLLPGFSVGYPRFSMTYQRIAANEDGLKHLLDGACDMVILPAQLNHPMVTSTFLLEEKMMLCVPKDHPYATKSAVYLEDLRGMQLMVTQTNVHDDPLVKKFKAYLDQRGIPFQYVEQTDFATIRYLMNSTNLCNILSDLEWAIDSYPNRAALPIKNEIAFSHSYASYLTGNAAYLKPVVSLLKSMARK